ncbi:hypothetical protein J6500_25550 [Bradyrhizobium sp. WSM 1704]|uniref:hypothetical protein n=1 Tax=Bradyrhizobium semiaridum TaxID=2821404 RepID=UPI001CE2ACC6|nr:hypothetical protein [Bradyrhizobium semiaridum]MCA6125233.1 hypothetical protein [Bradyrhizobium semiaridum]
MPGNGPAQFISDSTVPSVLRTGTGDLELLAGGNYTQDSLYGVYTAGTQATAAVDPKYQPSQMLGNGRLAEDQMKRLTEEERNRLNALVVQSDSR